MAPMAITSRHEIGVLSRGGDSDQICASFPREELVHGTTTTNEAMPNASRWKSAPRQVAFPVIAGRSDHGGRTSP